MEHLLEDLEIFGDNTLLRGFVFGIVHTIIPLIGFYTGYSINRLLKIASNGMVAGIFGVVISHVIADFIAASLDPHLRPAVIGIVVGGILPLIFVPFLEKYVTKSKHHIVVGDHDEVAADLKSEHHHDK